MNRHTIIGLQAFARLFCAVLLVAFAASIPARGEPAADLRGVALIVGNGAYEALPELANPENDADAIEELLSDLGFDSVARTDRDADQLKRDLERFVEDAADADVAVLYYAGHGIEAGGENWLVPTDADLSALDDAAGRLVPLSDVLMRLREVVPVTILLLDACRDNPFPPGVSLKKTPDAEPVPVAVGGLAETRGAARVTVEAAPEDNLGMVIGFAAEPGRPALDGDGEHSPYAAALLRHLAAMAGEEFGTVMRMVAEEVYLKTGGRQRPWVNESLRRLLYFGEAPAPVSGPEGDILAERRGLLLTIADLPLGERRTVERVAANGGVPMDGVYAMLKALGSDAPDDPAELDAVLRRQAEQLKAFLAERRIVENPDPELARLAALTDHAVAEGAIAAARRLRGEVDRRIDELSAVIEREEDLIRARRTEFAAEYARSAEISALAFDHGEAARYYRKAFAEIERWDDRLAWQYKNAEVVNLTNHGEYKGDNRALEAAIAASRAALRVADALDDRERWFASKNALGTALWTLGRRENGTEHLEMAIAAYRAALDAIDREQTPLEWSAVQNNLAGALSVLGNRRDDIALLREAVAAHRAALEERRREDVPAKWAISQNNLGNVLLMLGEREGNTALIGQAADAHRAALTAYPRDRFPLNWALSQNNLGNALYTLGREEGSVGQMEAAIAAYRAALEERTRERVPLDWARTQYNLGIALHALGGSTGERAHLASAVLAYRAALRELTRLRAPRLWAGAWNNLGSALRTLGELNGHAALLDQAIEAYRTSLKERTREADPSGWAATYYNLAQLLSRLGSRAAEDPTRAGRHLAQAIASARAAQRIFTQADKPLRWATLQNLIGYDLVLLGEQTDALPLFEEAVPILRQALEVQQALQSKSVPFTADSLCRALLGLGERKRDRAMLLEAKAVCESAAAGLIAAGKDQLAATTARHLQQTNAALETLE